MSVAARLVVVRQRIAAAATEGGRDPEAVRLVAVSKTKPPELVREAYEAGQRDFGENYAQELVAKAQALTDLPDLRWHMIGHLQRNKAKQVVRVAHAVHTVDSVRLAEELARRTAPDTRLLVLVEINVGGEAQKGGCTPDEAREVVDAVERHESLALRGLMTVPPHTEDPAGARPYFDALARLRDALGGPTRLPELSMGMTHDLEHAIRAGATMVRVGTAIFGERG